MHEPGTATELPHPGITIFLRTPDGAVQHVQHGFANLEHRVPIIPETVMNVGSVAKQITAYLTIRAARAGLVQLETSVARFLPAVTLHDVTLLDLIRHSGGIRDTESMLSLAGLRDLDHYTAADLLRLSYRQQKRAAPAGHFLYSNTGYLMLAEVLRKVYGKTLQSAAAELLFDPLGMTTAQFRDDPTEIIPHGASSYKPCRNGVWRNAARPVALAGPGSLWCSTSDLDKWLGHLHALWVSRHKEGLPLDHFVPYVQSDRHPYVYGPGVYADPAATDPTIFHAGHEQGFSAIAHLAASGLRLICMSNRADTPADQLAAPILSQHVGGPHDLREIATQATRRAPNQANAELEKTDDTVPAEPLGMFTCVEVPGTLRLERVGDRLRLWRRGTYDDLTRLHQSPPTFASPGITVILRNETACSPITEFTLDLERAPGLRYRRSK